MACLFHTAAIKKITRSGCNNQSFELLVSGVKPINNTFYTQIIRANNKYICYDNIQKETQLITSNNHYYFYQDL